MKVAPGIDKIRFIGLYRYKQTTQTGKQTQLQTQTDIQTYTRRGGTNRQIDTNRHKQKQTDTNTYKLDTNRLFS